jgi:hypothetical protein
MGSDWLERYWLARGHVPPEVNLGSGHIAALGKLLDLTLRFAVLDGLPGVPLLVLAMAMGVRSYLNAASLNVKTRTGSSSGAHFRLSCRRTKYAIRPMLTRLTVSCRRHLQAIAMRPG